MTATTPRSAPIRLAIAAALAAGLALAVGAFAQQVQQAPQPSDYNPQLLTTAQSALTRESSRLADQAEKDALAQQIKDLADRSAAIAKMPLPPPGTTSLDLTAAQDKYTHDKGLADAARQHADATESWGKTRLQQILQSQNTICNQMGGAVTGNRCIFTCQSDQMAVCAQKTAAFDRAVADLKTTIEDVGRQVDEAGAAADSAEKAAADSNEALQKIQDDMKKVEELKTAKSEFLARLDAFYTRLSNAKHTPLLRGTEGPAWRQLLQQNNRMHQPGALFPGDCLENNCVDLGAKPDGTLVVPPAAAPGVGTSSTTYKQADAQVRTLVPQFNAQRADVLNAIATNAPDKDAKIAAYAKTLADLESTRYTLHHSTRAASVPVPAHP